jgi:AcrR family transcriptional regulator
MGVRKYEQKQRAEAADETRRRILDSVYQRLRDAPTEPVSIERVAAMAGVSRSTIYLVFGSRAGLFDALGEDLRKSGGFERAVDATKVDNPRASLLESIRLSAWIFAEHRDVLRVLYSMSQLDPDAVGGAIQRMGDGRASGLAWYVEQLAKRNELRAGLTVEDATNVLWALTGFEYFDQLYTGRGLPREAVASLMLATIEHAVLSSGG